VRPALDIVVEDPAIKADDKWNSEFHYSPKGPMPCVKPIHELPFRSAVKPCWSSDGRLLATNLSIWRVNSGNRLTRVRDIRNGAIPVGFSQDGKLFAYLKLTFIPDKLGSLKTEKTGLPELWVCRVRGSGERRIADSVISATWSPNGEYFAVIQVEDAESSTKRDAFSLMETGRLRASIINDTGRRKVELVGCRLSAGCQGAWSPDGSRFTDGGSVWSIPSDPTKTQLLSHLPSEPGGREFGGPRSYQTPKWSADGKSVQMVYVKPLGGMSTEALVALDADSGRVTALAKNAYLNGWEFFGASDWSPDGSRLAVAVDYGTVPDNVPNRRNMTGVWLVSRDAKDQVQIAELYSYSNRSGFGSSYGPRNGQWAGSDPLVSQGTPSWSPDGTKIAVILPSAPEKLHILTVPPDSASTETKSEQWKVPPMP